jgi:hypothetical protein
MHLAPGATARLFLRFGLGLKAGQHQQKNQDPGHRSNGHRQSSSDEPSAKQLVGRAAPVAAKTSVCGHEVSVFRGTGTIRDSEAE